MARDDAVSVLIEVFRRAAGEKCFTRRVTRGDAQLAPLDVGSDGYAAQEPTGYVTLRGVPAGAFVVSDYARVLGVVYQVKGVAPRPPDGRLADVTASPVRPRGFLVASALTVGGVPLTVGGVPLEACVEA